MNRAAFDTKFSRTSRTLKEGMARFIAKCPKKGCKEIKTADVRQTSMKFRSQMPPYSENVVLTPVKSELPSANCPTHNLPMGWTRIEGKLSEARRCDPRCTSATGPICICACGGANHSADYL